MLHICQYHAYTHVSYLHTSALHHSYNCTIKSNLYHRPVHLPTTPFASSAPNLDPIPQHLCAWQSCHWPQMLYIAHLPMSCLPNACPPLLYHTQMHTFVLSLHTSVALAHIYHIPTRICRKFVAPARISLLYICTCAPALIASQSALHH